MNPEHARRALKELLEDELPDMVEAQVKRIIRAHAAEIFVIAAKYEDQEARNNALGAYLANWALNGS